MRALFVKQNQKMIKITKRWYDKNELNLEEIDVDEDISVGDDLFSEDETEGGVYVEEDDVFGFNSSSEDEDADDDFEIPKTGVCGWCYALYITSLILRIHTVDMSLIWLLILISR